MARFLEFALNHYWLAGAFAGLLAAFAFVEILRGGRSLSPQALTLMMNNQQAVVIDIRDPAEFRQGHITSSRNIPYSKLMEQSGELPKDKPVIIVCNLGQVAGAATKQLKAIGLSEVYRLEGGISNWKSLSLPLVKR